ncbi:hypothetical protein QTP70_008082 [Hemibagrus guttatus]|uniref:Reverse transcriptase domain-containing protein n=1 Tax=Hemibagrus guttatus TaxID=175788 RepID=A0AAE0PYF1_9TELE|nr:hypothetical protein QTP70_008082 [Hemibagrus guttatus]KAK3527708.1 hypothetical protein QTP86_000343 [Hemibagrus guttatus]
MPISTRGTRGAVAVRSLVPVVAAIPEPSGGHRNVSGELLALTGDIVGRWKEYFEDLLNPTDTPSVEGAEAEDSELVQQLLSGKAPGVDEIRPEYLKSLDVVGLSLLTHIPGVLEGSWEFAQPVHMCFLDLEKAFDRVPRGILWEVLWEYGVCGPLLRAVRSLYDRSRSLVCIVGCEDSFKLHSVDLELEAVEKQICDLQVKQAQLRQRKAVLESSWTDAHLSQVNSRRETNTPTTSTPCASLPRPSAPRTRPAQVLFTPAPGYHAAWMQQQRKTRAKPRARTSPPPPPPIFEISTRNCFAPLRETECDTVIIGDSIVRQVRATAAKGKVRTRCLPGARVLNVSAQVSAILKKNIGAVILHAGTNDIRLRQTEILKDFRSLVEKLHQQQICGRHCCGGPDLQQRRDGLPRGDMVTWCQDNNLLLKVSKTKELIVDFSTKQERNYQPLIINGTLVERVDSFRYLGVHIMQDLSWSGHVNTLVKKARQCLYHLRCLKDFKLPCTIDSILMGSITAWFGNSTKQDRRALQRAVRSAERTIRTELPDLETIYSKRCWTKARKIMKYLSHPNNGLFSLLRTQHIITPPPVELISTQHIITPPPVELISTQHIITPPPVELISTQHIITPPPVELISTQHIITPPPVELISTQHIITPPPVELISTQHIITPPPPVEQLVCENIHNAGLISHLTDGYFTQVQGEGPH